MEKEKLYIDGDFIRLGQLLKHLNLISSGGMAKIFLLDHEVLVNQTLEDRRGRKLYPGDKVEIPSESLVIEILEEND